MSTNTLPGLDLTRPEPPEPTEPAGNGYTERDMLNLLATRYGRVYGNGERWARAEHVRSHAGAWAPRTADYIAMDLWPSKGLALHGHEVKVSRSDWLTELRDPSKADEFRRYMDYWWLVAADKAIVRGDLPDGWGLMAPVGGALRVLRQAPRLTPQPVPRTLLATLMKAAATTADRAARRELARL